MNERTDQRFTLRELAAQAAGFLSSADVDQESGRVSDVPSSRTIRYYASHGLLDAPTDWEGRTAIYGMRHVMQLVAIKRLQARGATLAQIQERLHGLPEAKLVEIAQIDMTGLDMTGLDVGGIDSDSAEVEEVGEVEPATNPRRGDSFWAARGTRKRDGAAAEKVAPEVEALRLDDDALLIIEGLARSLDEDDIHALRVAAEPLLHLLKARRIVGSGNDHGGQQ